MIAILVRTLDVDTLALIDQQIEAEFKTKKEAYRYLEDKGCEYFNDKMYFTASKRYHIYNTRVRAEKMIVEKVKQGA